ncbi:MAG: hypothetical protein LBE27_06825 [Deltaproteobacteria bacterium]|jgi:hypothetical protein|nr:hypothetical protein [Deltaproteobacteria bacterium]
MFKRIHSLSKTALLAAVIMAVLSLMIQGVFSTPVSAQPGDDPNYKYPVLTDKDFQLFLNLIDYLETDKDPELFYKDNNVTEEYAQVVIYKISVNTMGILTGNTEEVGKEFGQNIVFSPEETQIFDKYQDQIIAGLVKLGSKPAEDE